MLTPRRITLHTLNFAAFALRHTYFCSCGSNEIWTRVQRLLQPVFSRLLVFILRCNRFWISAAALHGSEMRWHAIPCMWTRVFFKSFEGYYYYRIRVARGWTPRGLLIGERYASSCPRMIHPTSRNKPTRTCHRYRLSLPIEVRRAIK